MMTAEGAHLSRGTAVILANTVFEYDNRVRKEAESLTAAGFDVVRIGFVRQDGDLEDESTAAGRILRIRKSHAGGAPAPQGSQQPRDAGIPVGNAVRELKHLAVRIGGPIDDLRHYAGRREENRLLFAAAASLKPSLTIACDLDTLSAGVRLKDRVASYLVYDAHELYTEQYAAWSALRRTMYRRLEGRLIRRADLVTTVGPLVARQLQSAYRCEMPHVLLNGPSAVIAEPTPVHHPVRVLFQGAFAANRGLVPLVAGMARLRGRAQLALQGFGPLEGELRELVAGQGLSDVVRFIDPCPPADVVSCGSEHDIGVISYPPITKNLLFATPNKLFDYLGAGLALATLDAPGITEVVDVDRCGIRFDGRRPEAVFEALDSLVRDTDDLARRKRESVRIAAELTWDRQWGQVQDRLDAGMAGRRVG